MPAGPLSTRIEIIAWIAIGAIALGARALNLDGAPLQPDESVQALNSWSIVQRTGLTLGAHPLLIYANALIFLVAGATDATARLLPMIAGFFTALSPLAFRSKLGRGGAAIAGLALAISPTLVLTSRSVDSVALSLAFGVGLVAACLAYQRERRAAYLYAAILLVIGLLASGPVGPQLALIFGAYALTEGTRGAATARSGALASAESSEQKSRAPSFEVAGIDSSTSKRLAVFAGISYAVASTGFGTNPSGLGDALAGPIGGWLAGFGQEGPHALAVLAAMVLAYEPLTVLFGIGGFVRAHRGGRPFEQFLAWWAAGGVLLFIVAGRNHLTWISMAIVPLAMLAGTAIARLAPAVMASETRKPLALFALLGLSFVYTIFIALGNVTLPEPNVPTSVLAAPVLALALLAVTFAWRFGWPLTGVATSATAFVLCLVLSVHAMMLLNPGGSLNAAEAPVGVATSPDVRTLADQVSTVLNELHIARQLEGLPVSETVEVAEPYDRPLAWYLRQWRQTQVVASVDDAPAVAIQSFQAKPPRGAYAAQTFQLSTAAPLPSLNAVEMVRWWLYREAPGATETYVKVFVKTQLARR
jgi:uncharacterized protein (TIGR03663 family)